jgi:hypothetical protein
MNDQNLTITLTDDELLTFLYTLGLTSIVGLDDEFLSRFDEHEILNRLNSGEQSLINRGLINLSEANEEMLDNTLVALVGTSAIPEATLLLSLVQSNERKESHYFNATSKLLVEYFPSPDGLHRFDYVPDIANLIERIKNLLSVLPGIDGKFSDICIEIDIFTINQLIELIQKNSLSDAQILLINAGIDQSIATMFIRDYVNCPLWTGTITWNLRNPEIQDKKTVIAVTCDNYCWLLENLTHDHKYMYIRRVDGEYCLQTFIQLLEPIRKIY